MAELKWNGVRQADFSDANRLFRDAYDMFNQGLQVGVNTGERLLANAEQNTTNAIINEANKANTPEDWADPVFQQALQEKIAQAGSWANGEAINEYMAKRPTTLDENALLKSKREQAQMIQADTQNLNSALMAINNGEDATQFISQLQSPESIQMIMDANKQAQSMKMQQQGMDITKAQFAQEQEEFNFNKDQKLRSSLNEANALNIEYSNQIAQIDEQLKGVPLGTLDKEGNPEYGVLDPSLENQLKQQKNALIEMQKNNENNILNLQNQFNNNNTINTKVSGIGGMIQQAESKGDYGIANTPRSNGHKISDIRVDNMTVGEVRQAQENGDIFATGAYQIIPNTLQEAISKGFIDENTPYNKETQDRLYTDYLTREKRPQIYSYIVGDSDNREAAIQALANEWAGVPQSNGKSRYGKDGYNKANISIEELIQSIDESKALYQQYTMQGIDSDTAYRAAMLGQDLSNTNTQENINNIVESSNNLNSNTVLANEYANAGFINQSNIENQNIGNYSSSEAQILEERNPKKFEEYKNKLLQFSKIRDRSVSSTPETFATLKTEITKLEEDLNKIYDSYSKEVTESNRKEAKDNTNNLLDNLSKYREMPEVSTNSSLYNSIVQDDKIPVPKTERKWSWLGSNPLASDRDNYNTMIKTYIDTNFEGNLPKIINKISDILPTEAKERYKNITDDIIKNPENYPELSSKVMKGLFKEFIDTGSASGNENTFAKEANGYILSRLSELLTSS